MQPEIIGENFRITEDNYVLMLFEALKLAKGYVQRLDAALQKSRIYNGETSADLKFINSVLEFEAYAKGYTDAIRKYKNGDGAENAENSTFCSD